MLNDFELHMTRGHQVRIHYVDGRVEEAFVSNYYRDEDDGGPGLLELGEGRGELQSSIESIEILSETGETLTEFGSASKVRIDLKTDPEAIYQAVQKATGGI